MPLSLFLSSGLSMSAKGERENSWLRLLQVLCDKPSVSNEASGLAGPVCWRWSLVAGPVCYLPVLLTANVAGNEELILPHKRAVWRFAAVHSLPKGDKHSFVPPTCKVHSWGPNSPNSWLPNGLTIKIPWRAFTMCIVGSLYP